METQNIRISIFYTRCERVFKLNLIKNPQTPMYNPCFYVVLCRYTVIHKHQKEVPIQSSLSFNERNINNVSINDQLSQLGLSYLRRYQLICTGPPRSAGCPVRAAQYAHQYLPFIHTFIFRLLDKQRLYSITIIETIIITYKIGFCSNEQVFFNNLDFLIAFCGKVNMSGHMSIAGCQILLRLIYYFYQTRTRKGQVYLLTGLWS